MTTVDVTPLARLEATPYEAHRGYVLAVLARRCGWLEPDEREAIFHDAYLVMLEKERSGALDTGVMAPEQLRAYLVQTAIHKSLDEGKRAGRKRSAPLDEGACTALDRSPTPYELVADGFESAQVREIVAELPERQQIIVKLRFFFDRTPHEIQDYLKVSERAYRRELERAMRTIAERMTLVREGHFCDTRRSLILAYVSGVAGPNRARSAREHLASCPGCARWAAELRDSARRVAGAVPLPPVALSDGTFDRIASAVEGARHGIAAAVSGAKHQATAVATRVDASTAGYTSAARPGAAVAAVAGCLAIGGGAATYCAVQGLPEPLRPIVGLKPAAKPPPERERVRRASSAVDPPVAAPPVTTPPVTTPPVTTPVTTPPAGPPAEPEAPPVDSPPEAAQPAEAQPPPVDEFALEGAETLVEESPAPPPVALPAPAPAPAPDRAQPSATPPGEFDP